MPRDILNFWFPEGLDRDFDTHRQRMLWWMRGGADAELIERFSEVTRAAAAGELDDWADTAEGRLALIIVLDQFSRSVYRDTAAAYAQDPHALRLAIEGIENGDYDQFAGEVWKQFFFAMPLGHAEGPDLRERIERQSRLADDQYQRAPAHLKPIYDFSRQQPREHGKVIERFGRHPHRNAALGRRSSPEELAYLREGKFPHQRELSSEPGPNRQSSRPKRSTAHRKDGWRWPRSTRHWRKCAVRAGVDALAGVRLAARVGRWVVALARRQRATGS